MFGSNNDDQQAPIASEPASAPPMSASVVPNDDLSAAASSLSAAATAYEMADAPTLPAAPIATSEPTVAAPVPAAGPQLSDGDHNDLLTIKKDVLSQLSPLVGHLDQTPEEKFKTTMMMLQSTDDHSLVKTAYEAAQQITDEKEKAQALLDIVNEINYFTQPQA